MMDHLSKDCSLPSEGTGDTVLPLPYGAWIRAETRTYATGGTGGSKKSFHAAATEPPHVSPAGSSASGVKENEVNVSQPVSGTVVGGDENNLDSATSHVAG